MTIRTKLFVVLATLAAPAAAFAATTPTAGTAEAAARSGHIMDVGAAATPQSSAAFTLRFREAVAGGAGYTDASQIAGEAFAGTPSSRAVLDGREQRIIENHGLTSYDASLLRE